MPWTVWHIYPQSKEPWITHKWYQSVSCEFTEYGPSKPPTETPKPEDMQRAYAFSRLAMDMSGRIMRRSTQMTHRVEIMRRNNVLSGIKPYGTTVSTAWGRWLFYHRYDLTKADLVEKRKHKEEVMFLYERGIKLKLKWQKWKSSTFLQLKYSRTEGRRFSGSSRWPAKWSPTNLRRVGAESHPQPARPEEEVEEKSED